LRRLRRQGDRLERRQIEAPRRAVDIEADDVAGRVEVDVKSRGDLARLGARSGFQFDVEAVRFRIVMQFHCPLSRKSRSKKALWIVSPSSSVTTRSARAVPVRPSITRPQWRMRPSSWV